jgi:hypothetical protein
VAKIIFFLIAVLVYLAAIYYPLNREDWREWDFSYDGSVGCPAYQPMKIDVGMSANVFGVMTLTTNNGKVPGLFLNGIAGKHHNFIDNSQYIFSGSFRKPHKAQDEHIDINLQFVEDFIEYHAEIFWTLNPYSPLYGWIWTRYELDKPVKLFHLGDDTNWHRFEIVANYKSHPKSRKVYSLKVDDSNFLLDRPMGTNPKEWEESFMTLLEVHNTYTNCSPLLTFVGKSEWKNIKLKRIELYD